MYQGYPGGSDTPFYTPIFARLVERGHAVRVLIGPGVRETRLPVNDLHLNGSGANLMGPSAMLAPEPERSAMDKLETLEELCEGRHFGREVIILCVRWYLQFKLSLRDVVETW